MARRKRYTVAIDFDGTICEWAFPAIGALKPGAKEAINSLKEEYEIVISSCRTSALYRNEPRNTELVAEMEAFLQENGIFYDRIDRGNEGKVVAKFYIDDRAIQFTDWGQVLREII